ncbi:MAG: ion transporter [Candidatus Nanoarchaeia archaeon]
MHLITSNSIFEFFILFIIITSAIIIGVETYDIENSFINALKNLDYVITFIFLVEITARFLSYDKYRDFFKSGWNIFDLIIVSISLIPLPSSDYVLLARLLRIVRILRIIQVLPELKLLISSLIRSLPNIFYISILLLIIIYIYAAIGNALFETINPELWGNIGISMLTLFNLMTFDAWAEVLHEVLDVYPYAWIYFISYAFFTVFTFLNLFIGAILSGIEREIEKDKEKSRKEQSEEIKYMKKKLNLIENKIDVLVEQSSKTSKKQ